MYSAVIIFLITYIVISGSKFNALKIGRPAGVMLGAVLMIVAKVIKPQEVYGVINWDTVVLLLGMMIIIEHLAEANFFEYVAEKINRKNYGSNKLLFILTFCFGFLAAFLVNDIVCIFFTPILLIMIRERKLPAMPFLLALASSANVGSIMAFTGNPQNMIIGTISGIAYSKFFLLMLPIGIVTLYLNYYIISKMYKRELSGELIEIKAAENVKVKPLLKRSVTVTIAVILCFFMFKKSAWVAISGATALLLLARRDEADILKKIDWNLLLFFAGLFVVVGGLQISGVTEMAVEKTAGYMGDNLSGLWFFGIFTMIASNIVTNVPYVLLISDSVRAAASPEQFWFVLAFASTIAGNITIIGSVANVIVVERSKESCIITFWDFFKLGLPSTVINFIIGMSFLSLYKIAGFF